jgi:hypothetical protein
MESYTTDTGTTTFAKFEFLKNDYFSTKVSFAKFYFGKTRGNLLSRVATTTTTN